MTKRAILFVHGSWHTPAHFQIVRDVFQQAGYETRCPRHPSVGNLPPVGMMDDAKCIADELAQLVESQGKDVVIVAHSYGGIVTSQGVEEHLGKAFRERNGQKGGLIRIIYLAAFLVPVGAGICQALGVTDLPPIIPVDDQDMCIMMNPQKMFYHDLPPAEQDKWAAEMRKSPISTQYATITQAAYLFHPISYIYCTQDVGMTYQIQQKMVAEVSEQYGLSISTAVLEASHSAMLSMPDQVLTTVETLLEVYLNGN